MSMDSRLRWILEEATVPGEAFGDAMALVEGSPFDSSVPKTSAVTEVLVRAMPSIGRDQFEAELRDVGLEIHTLSDGKGALTASGRIEIGRLTLLDGNKTVARVEAPRQLQSELLFSIKASRADTAHCLVPAAVGSNALVGVIDGGIDFRHPVFVGIGGGTRIESFWDQTAPRVAGQTVPYGRVYSRAEIDAALQGAPLSHSDDDGHGTHVASIAAGAIVRNGVAPAADLLIVNLGSDGQTLGRSKNAMDAFGWIVDRAKQNRKPVAINMSQGMNGGGHTGSSVLEIAMDGHCREPGVAIVKSAGNEQEMFSHARGMLAANSLCILDIVCLGTKRTPGQLEIWFDDGDDFEVSLQPPTGAPTSWVSIANMPRTINIGGNRLRLDVEFDPEGTGDHVLNVFFSAGSNPAGILQGTWRVLLRAAELKGSGLLHAWLERTARDPESEQLCFSGATRDQNCTISTPGTARRVITVGSYVTTSPSRGVKVGSLSTFSSHGPTRFGVRKPDIIAPGEMVEAARSSTCPEGSGLWLSLQGTSMAAPHAAGAAALVLSELPTLTGEQVRQVLTRSARPTASSPDNATGAGYLDVVAAVALVRGGAAKFPTLASARLTGSSFQVSTFEEATALLLYDANAGRLLAGRWEGQLASPTPSKSHTFDLAAFGTGSWHFELHLLQDGWLTIADDDGVPWSIVVP